MDGGQNNTPVFRSDDIATAHSSKNKDNYFVNVIKNPFLRWLLRAKKIEEEKVEEPKPKKPIEKAPEKPKPQFRTTIRISTLKLENERKKHKNTIIIFSIVTLFLAAAAIFFAFSSPIFSYSPRDGKITEEEIYNLRKDLLSSVGLLPINSENIDSAIAAMDAKINLIPSGDLRQSLKLYKLSLLIDSGYLAEALGYFREIENEYFPNSQLCELYEYRLLISKKSSSVEDVDEYQTKYRNLCTDWISDDEKSNETENKEPEKQLNKESDSTSNAETTNGSKGESRKNEEQR